MLPTLEDKHSEQQHFITTVNGSKEHIIPIFGSTCDNIGDFVLTPLKISSSSHVLLLKCFHRVSLHDKSGIYSCDFFCLVGLVLGDLHTCLLFLYLFQLRLREGLGQTGPKLGLNCQTGDPQAAQNNRQMIPLCKDGFSEAFRKHLNKFEF